MIDKLLVLGLFQKKVVFQFCNSASGTKISAIAEIFSFYVKPKPFPPTTYCPLTIF